jgi:hypothetical protein
MNTSTSPFLNRYTATMMSREKARERKEREREEERERGRQEERERGERGERGRESKNDSHLVSGETCVLMGDVGAIAVKMSVSRNLQPVKNVYALAQIQKVPGNYVSNSFE